MAPPAKSLVWDDIERAVQRAVCLASKLDPNQVIWAHQNTAEPAGDHIVLSFGGETVVGQDRVESIFDPSRPRGQEFRQVVRGMREVPLELQAFTSATTGERSARRLLELVRARLQLESIRAPLNRAGCTPFDASAAVGWVPDIPGAVFRGRATHVIRCYVPVLDGAVEEAVGYISVVSGRVVPSGALLYSGMTGFPFTAYVGTGYAGPR